MAQYGRNDPPPYPLASAPPQPVSAMSPYPVSSAVPYSAPPNPVSSAPSAPYPTQGFSAIDFIYRQGCSEISFGFVALTEVPSLIRLSACASVEQISYVSEKFDLIPRDLWPILLQAALIKVLVSAHPGSYRIQKVAESPHMTCYNVEKGFENKFYIATALLHNFIECLRLRVDTCNLRVLDLRGFPINNLAASYLSVYCILSHDEAKRNRIQKLIKDVVGKGTFEQDFIDKAAQAVAKTEDDYERQRSELPHCLQPSDGVGAQHRVTKIDRTTTKTPVSNAVATRSERKKQTAQRHYNTSEKATRE
ncbi:unnamed protein product [Soboliphyme baturini]|uniref:FH2 domain-containing protein n=1 Tax=Soboliphyme baturini TaxID=241478 RepID=A0A183IZG9_9BILA|nr:unnamed protein product [Soboliphyme baturini]